MITDDFGGVAVADAPKDHDEFGGVPVDSSPTKAPAPSIGDEQASGDEIGNLGAPEGSIPRKGEMTPDGVLQESHPYAWARIRQTPFMRKILGPTDDEKAAMANGTLAGPPGGDPGIVPIIMASPGPFLPGPESRAGQVLLSYFIGRNIASQPARVQAITQKFQSGDTKGAWHDILADTLDTGMAGLGAVSLAGKAKAAFENAAEPEPNLDTMRRVQATPEGQPAEEGAPVPQPSTDEFGGVPLKAAPADPAPGSVPLAGADETGMVTLPPPAQPAPTPVEPPPPPENSTVRLPDEIDLALLEAEKRAASGDTEGMKGPISAAYGYLLDRTGGGTGPISPQGQAKHTAWFNEVNRRVAAIDPTNPALPNPKVNPAPVAISPPVEPLATTEPEAPAPRGQQPGPNYVWNSADPLDEGPQATPVPMATMAQPAVLNEPIKQPVTAPRFSATLYQGRGATPEQIYGEDAVKEGRAAPLFGNAQYFAFDEKTASQFGKVTKHAVQLANPFILDSDAKWFQLLKDADAPHLNNMGMEFYKEPQKVPAAGEKVQKYLKAQGYDGIIVRLAHGDDSTRRLSAVAGDDQVVKFSEAASATKAKAAPVQPAEPPQTLPPVKVPKGPNKPIKLGPPKPAEPPAQAAAKVAQQVKTVAQTEGQRPAKEVKAELLKRIDEAMHGAPEVSAYKPGVHGTVEIAIPGDGTFKIPRHLAALGEVRARVNALDTRSTVKPSARKPSSKAPSVDATMRDAIAVYGDERNAIQKLQAQLGSDIEMEPEQRTRTERAIERLRENLPENKLRGRIAEVKSQISTQEQRSQNYERSIERLKASGKPGAKQKRDLQGALIGSRQAQEALDGQRRILASLNRDLVTLEASLTTPAPETKPLAPTPRGEGGKLRAKSQPAAPAEEASAPLTIKKANPLLQDINRLRANVAPQTISDDARNVGNLLRMLNAKMANEMLRADEALKPFRAEFDRTPVPKDYVFDPDAPLPRNLAFIDAYENGKTAGLTPVERNAAEVFKQQNNDWLERVHALGTGALRSLYENYFPHLWSDPVKAKEVFAKLITKSPLEGPKSFLRQRTHQLFVEGLKAGLTPVHDNPVDQWLLKKREVELYILARQFINELRSTGQLKFVHSFARKPEGFSTVDDPAFTQWGPPNINIEEYFDENQRTAMLDLLKHIGVTQQRLARLSSRGALGLAFPPPERRNEVKLGSTEATAWHEMGHQMDWKFPDLRERLKIRGNSPMAQQLRDFVDLRGEGKEVSQSRKDYFRETEEKIAELFKGYIHAPQLLKQVAPLVWKEFNSWLDDHPDIRQRVDAIQPRLTYGSEVTQVPLGGYVKLGEWMLPDAAARVVNNYLSPGLNPHLWYRSFREISNLLNGVQLGASAFHLGFTSLDAATSRLAVAIEDAARGDIARAMKTAASVPVSPITNIMLGRKVRAEVMKPGSQSEEIRHIAMALEMAGGRVGQDRFWRTEFTRRMMRALRSGTASGYLKGALQAPFALFEQSLRPIMDYVVPRQKLGVFADMAQREIERTAPDADPAEVRERMRLAWDSVDNRMGQLVYDNLFYNRWVKDVALLTFRAYGWQLGKYREGVGAAVDTVRAAKAAATGQRPEVTHRMAYAMALPMIIGLLGALATMYYTKRMPKGQDYFMPPTGETDASGNPVRLNFPSYMKDVLAYGKHPITSVGHSLNPMYSGMFDLLQNKDFYDVEIRHPDDPLWKQGSEVAQFAAKQFVPFSVSGAMKMHENGSPLQKEILPFFGITPVPSRMTMTPAQELASDLMSSGMGDEPLTQEQFDKSKMIRDMVRSIKAAPAARQQVLQEARDEGKLNPVNTEALIDRLKYTPLQFQVFHLGAADAMKVWRVANPDEQAQLKPLLQLKIINSKVMPMDQKRAALGEITRPVH